MKRFIVKDENEEIVEVEELDEEVHNEALSEDEISALKKLAASTEALLALLHKEDKVEDEEVEEDEEEVEEDEEKEEVLDTDEDIEEMIEEKKVAHDSKSSIGSIESKSKCNDEIDIQEEIAKAWAKRYGGQN